jgi:hypothetical protein
MGMTGGDYIDITADSEAELLLMEVPV